MQVFGSAVNRVTRLVMLILACLVALTIARPARAQTRGRAWQNPRCYYFDTAYGHGCGYRCTDWSASFYIEYCS